MISTKRVLGMVACIVLLASCFFGWAHYPDINDVFTGFYSRNNYYGRPGILLGVIAAVGIASYLINKVWMYRLNLVIAAIGMGYAIKSWLLFTSGYDGFNPQPKPAVYIMLGSALANLVVAVFCSAQRRMVNSATTTSA